MRAAPGRRALNDRALNDRALNERLVLRVTRTYALHGLRVRSQVQLDAPVVDPGPSDLHVRLGPRRSVPDAAPAGRLLAHLELPGGSSSLAAIDGAGYTLRIHSLCDFELDRELRGIQVHLAPDADTELASLFMGSVLAVALALKGCCVLHGSAVEVGGRALAFVGASGMGKTTVAAMFCVAGARLVTDDVLRVECRQERAWCFSGSSELRLRPAAAELAEKLESSVRRDTVDKRFAVRAAPAATGRLGLGAIVAPVWALGTEKLVIERLRGTDAMLELVRFPRTVGWVDSETARRDFGVLASLAREVPIYRAGLPWGPPFRADVAQALLASIGPDASRAPDPVLA
jgi:hypothetical protein